MRFLFPISSMILLASVACGSSTDVTATVPPSDPADPNFRVPDPDFRQELVSNDSGSEASTEGMVDQNAPTEGGSVDSGADSGFDPTDPDDAFCHSAATKTCEQALHCCMNVCKVLHSGTTTAGVVVPSCTTAVHVECVHSCEETHKSCVKGRHTHCK